MEFCFSRIYWARRDAECLLCQAPVAAGLERPPPSGDRWLRPVDSNRLLPSRYLAPGAAGLDDSKPGRLDRCKASVAPRTMTFRMDRSRERSLKHQTCRPKECASVDRKVAYCSSKLHASHSQTRTHHRSRCFNRAWITEGMQPATQVKKSEIHPHLEWLPNQPSLTQEIAFSVEADRSYEADSQTSPVPTATPSRC